MDTWKVTTASGETYESIHLEVQIASTFGVPTVLLSRVTKPRHLSQVRIKHHTGMTIEAIGKDTKKP